MPSLSIRKASTVIFSEFAEESMSPAQKAYWSSLSGRVVQFAILLLFMFFDAGVPILYQLWGIMYGGETQDIKFSPPAVMLTAIVCETGAMLLAAFGIRGVQGLRDAFQPMNTLRFSPAGLLFGMSGLLSMLSMSMLSADLYSVVSQAQLVVLAMSWTVLFRTPLSLTQWLALVSIASGLIGFNLSGTPTLKERLGILLMGLRMLCEAFACVYGEKFMKDADEDLYILIAWMKPVEFITCNVLLLVMPGMNGNPPEREVLMQSGFFHDWNLLTMGIVLTSMGDTIMTALLVKEFDSITKGIASAAGMLFPTQAFVQLIAKPHYTGLKIFSAMQVIQGVMMYVSASASMEKETALLDELRESRSRSMDQKFRDHSNGRWLETIPGSGDEAESSN